MPQSIVEELGRIPMAPNLAATLVRAADLARAQAMGLVTLEHLLLALADDPDAAMIFQVSAIEPVQLKADINAFLADAAARMSLPQGGEIVIAPDLRRVLEASAAAAQQGRRREINGAIVLAAIVGDGRSAAAQILRSRGLTFEDAIKALQRAVQSTQRPAPGPAAAAPPSAESRAPIPAPTPAAAPSPAPVAMPLPAGPPPAAPAASAGAGAQPGLRPATEDLLADVRERIAAQQPAVVPSGSTEARRHGQPPPHDFEVRPAPAAAAPRIPPAAAQPPPQGFEPKWEPAGLPPARARSSETAPAARQSQAEPPVPADALSRPPLPRGQLPQLPAEPAPRGEMPRTVPAQAEFPQPLPMEQTAAPPPLMQPAPWPEPASERRAPPPAQPMTAPAPPPHHPQRHVAEGPRPQPRSGPPGLPTAAGPPRGEQVSQARQRGTDRRAAPAVEPGQLVENIPRRMRVGVAALVEVRIARDKVQNLAKGMAGAGPPTHRQVMVTRAMSVRMRAPDGGFFIETASPETQWIDNALGINADDYASWRWTVTPSARGTRRLQLVISARTVGPDGLAAETALPEQIIEVKVGVNYGILARRWMGWILAALAGGALGKFGEGGIEALRALVRSAGWG